MTCRAAQAGVTVWMLVRHCHADPVFKAQMSGALTQQVAHGDTGALAGAVGTAQENKRPAKRGPFGATLRVDQNANVTPATGPLNSCFRPIRPSLPRWSTSSLNQS